MQKTLQVQNYFSLKDDGQYTCTAAFDNGKVLQAVETMKYPNRKWRLTALKAEHFLAECNTMCISGIVLSVTAGYVLTLLVMTTIAFGEDKNKIDRSSWLYKLQ